MKLWDWALTVLCFAWLAMLWWIGANDAPTRWGSAADWTAAIGSIAAAAAAVGIAVWDSRRGERLRIEARRDLEANAIKGVAAAHIHIRAAIAAAYSAEQDGSLTPVKCEQAATSIDGALRVLERIPIGDFPGTAFALPLMNLISAARTAVVATKDNGANMRTRPNASLNSLRYIYELSETSGDDLTALIRQSGVETV